MEKFVSGFIRASLVWLAIGTLLGAAMVYQPWSVGVFRAAHLHSLTLGFVSMMIFGVAYHAIPRFAGSPLRSRRLAGIHLWIANLGVAGMVAGWIGRGLSIGVAAPLLHTGTLLSTVGAWLFIVNIWRTLPQRNPDSVAVSGVHRPAPPVVRF